MADEDTEDKSEKQPKDLTDEDLQKEIEERQAELEKRLQAKKEKETEEKKQKELLEVIKLETKKLEEEREKLVEERLKFEEVLSEIKEESNSRSSSRPRSLALQKVSDDEESGHRMRSTVSYLTYTCINIYQLSTIDLGEFY